MRTQRPSRGMQSFMRRIPIRVLEQEGNPYLFSSPFEKDAMSETLNSPGHLREGIRRGSLTVQTTICRSGESHLGRTPSHAPRSGEKVSRAYGGLPPVRRRNENMRSTDGYISRCRATTAFATDPIRQIKKYPPSEVSTAQKTPRKHQGENTGHEFKPVPPLSQIISRNASAESFPPLRETPRLRVGAPTAATATASYVSPSSQTGAHRSPAKRGERERGGEGEDAQGLQEKCHPVPNVASCI